MQRFLVGTLVAIALLATACGGGFEFSSDGKGLIETAEELIEGGAMAQRLNVEPIADALCADPSVEEVGAVFTCTATSGGRPIDFTIEVESEDQLFAAPSNVVDASLVEGFAVDALETLNEQNDLSFPPGSLDCGSQSAVLDSESKMHCLLSDPETGLTYDVELAVPVPDEPIFFVEVVGLAE